MRFRLWSRHEISVLPAPRPPVLVTKEPNRPVYHFTPVAPAWHRPGRERHSAAHGPTGVDRHLPPPKPRERIEVERTGLWCDAEEAPGYEPAAPASCRGSGTLTASESLVEVLLLHADRIADLEQRARAALAQQASLRSRISERASELAFARGRLEARAEVVDALSRNLEDMRRMKGRYAVRD